MICIHSYGAARKYSNWKLMQKNLSVNDVTKIILSGAKMARNKMTLNLITMDIVQGAA